MCLQHCKKSVCSWYEDLHRTVSVHVEELLTYKIRLPLQCFTQISFSHLPGEIRM